MSRPGDPDPIRAETGRLVAARLDADPMVQRLAVPVLDIFHFPNFLSRNECKALIRMIDADARPSQVLTNQEMPGFRTSSTCDLDRADPDVRRLDARLSDLLGIPFGQGETVQGQRYAPGEQFKAHFDCFGNDHDLWPEIEAQGGQRTWTAMIYLNDVEQGGETWFARAGVRIAPVRGLLLCWNNMAPDGSPNPAALHEGMPVLRGTKYIVTKWFRERPWVQGVVRPY